MTARFHDFWNLGYRRLVPIVPPGADISPRSTLARRPADIGKAPGMRGEDGLWRGFDWMKHATTPEDLHRWESTGAGLGIRTGGGLVAVDIDTLDKASAALIVRTAGEMLGAAPMRVGRYPKVLLLYACSEDVPYQRVEFSTPADADPKKPPRVELLGEGRQFVAHGIHPVTGKAYAWYDPEGQAVPGPPPPDELPSVTPAQLDAFFARLSDILEAATPPQKSSLQSDAARDQDSLQADPALVAEAVRALPNTSALYGSYDDYVRVGAAIKGACGGAGEDLFVEWAMKWPDGGEEHTPERIAGDFRRIKPPYRLGANWLFDQAAKHGAFNAAREWFTPLEIEPVKPADPSRFRIETLLEAASKAREDSLPPLVKGLLDQGAASCVYGDSNVGKSLVVMDMTWHVAAGMRWGGLRTTRREVLYIAAEGGSGARKRSEALRRKYGPSPADGGLHIMLQAVDLLHPNVDLADLIAWLRLHPDVGLVVVDTMSRALAGGDENSSVDMGAFVKNFDALRAATGAHVLVIHHTGKDKARGMRGWSGMRAAIDTEIEVEEGKVMVTKQRDLDKTWATGFRIDGVDLWRDADDDAVTSATVSLTSLDAAEAVLAHKEAAALVAAQQNVLAALVGDTTQNTARLVSERMQANGVIGDVTQKRVSGDLAKLVNRGILVREVIAGRVCFRASEKNDLYITCMREAKKGPAESPAETLQRSLSARSAGTAENIFN